MRNFYNNIIKKKIIEKLPTSNRLLFVMLFLNQLTLVIIFAEVVYMDRYLWEIPHIKSQVEQNHKWVTLKNQRTVEAIEGYLDIEVESMLSEIKNVYVRTNQIEYAVRKNLNSLSRIKEKLNIRY
jgi:ABC-type bacteriocin/lantibiotic exporter with double-glycine peptidase domain